MPNNIKIADFQMQPPEDCFAALAYKHVQFSCIESGD